MVKASPVEIRGALDRILDRSVRDSAALAVVIARMDGLVIAHRLASGQDPRVASAVAASIFGAAEVATQQLEQGPIEQILIVSRKGNVIAVHAGPEAIVLALFSKEHSLGLALLGLSRTAKEVADVLEGV